ncbi:MAG: AsmA family protein, partial [Candidatus Omnitrophica bacterium]|nr:AsmA family protein [Candidatus Omnitrophota bacterium]
MHWTRKTIYTLLTIFILSHFLYFYIQNIFLPVQFKRFVIARAQEYLQRNVTIDEIHFSPLRGFIVRNVTVYQKDDPERVFLQADEVSFHVLLAPVFQKKIILIPSMRVSGPFAQIVREDTNRWNFSDLLATEKSPSPRPEAPRGEGTSGKSSWTLAPRKIIVKNGEIAYTDQTVPGNFHEVINGIELDARFSLNKIVRFTLQGRIPRRESTVNIKGNYYLESRRLSARVIAERVALAQYLSLIPSPSAKGSSPSGDLWLPQDIHFQDGIITSLDLNLNWEPDGLQVQGSAAVDKMDVELAEGKKIVTSAQATDVSLTRQDGRWTASGHLESDSTFITFAQGRSLNGKISADIKSLDISPQGMSAQGSLILEETRVVTGENKGIRAQTVRANDFVMRNDERGIRLETALNINGLDAAFSVDYKLRGDLTTQKTKFAFDEGRLGILSDLQFSDGRMDWAADKFLQTDLKSHETQLICQGGGCEIKSDLSLRNAHLQLTPQIALEGHPDGNLTYQYDPNGQDNKYLYSGELHFADGVIKDVPYVGRIEKIRGTIQIETNRLASGQLSFQAQGTDIEASGSLINFGQPLLNIKAKTDNLDLQKLFAAFPVLAEKTNFTAAGTAAVETSYLGDIKSPATADIQLNAKLHNATITSPKVPGEITGISGEIDYKKDLIVWKDLQGLYQKNQYTINGQFADFSRPTVDVEVTSQDLTASAQIKILNQAFQIVFLTGKYFNSSMDIKGDVHLL